MMIGGGENDEIVSADAVAEVQRKLAARPLSCVRDALEIEPKLWCEAQEQLKASLEARGWPLSTDGRCDRPNFLLHGVPVVMSNG